MLRVAYLGIGALLLGPAPMEAPKAPEAKQVKKVVREVKLLCHPSGGRLGVMLEDVDADAVASLKLAEEYGARVIDVVEESPAAEVGLKVDDVIVAYQGQRVESARQLARMVKETPPGRKVALELLRDGERTTIEPTLADATPELAWTHSGDDEDVDITIPEMPDMSHMPHMPRRVPMPPHGAWGMAPMPWMEWMGQPRKLGITYQEISGQLAEYFKVKGETAVLVTGVDDDGPAAKAGIKAGDLILQLGDSSIDDAESLLDAVDGAEPGAAVGVTVQRDGKAMQLEVVMGGKDRKHKHPRMPERRT